MTVALFCPVWACGAGIFSADPVTMVTVYIGHGEAFHPNSSELGLDKPLVVFYDVKHVLYVGRTQ